MAVALLGKKSSKLSQDIDFECFLLEGTHWHDFRSKFAQTRRVKAIGQTPQSIGY
jgi:hypothetical protein